MLPPVLQNALQTIYSDANKALVVLASERNGRQLLLSVGMLQRAL